MTQKSMKVYALPATFIGTHGQVNEATIYLVGSEFYTLSEARLMAMAIREEMEKDLKTRSVFQKFGRTGRIEFNYASLTTDVLRTDYSDKASHFVHLPVPLRK